MTLFNELAIERLPVAVASVARKSSLLASASFASSHTPDRLAPQSAAWALHHPLHIFCASLLAAVCCLTAVGCTGGFAFIAHSRVALRHRHGVGTRGNVHFAAQILAYVYPCQRFTPHLTVRRA